MTETEIEITADSLAKGDDELKEYIVAVMKRAIENGKQPVAAALGVVGGRSGGRAAADNLTKQQRSDRATIASLAAIEKKGKKLTADQIYKREAAKERLKGPKKGVSQ